MKIITEGSDARELSNSHGNNMIGRMKHTEVKFVVELQNKIELVLGRTEFALLAGVIVTVQ